MKNKKKSIIASFIIIVLILIFSALTVISIITPDIPNEIKKDLTKGINSLCEGNIEDYYNIYNTRKLTEIEKTKFYDKINETQELINKEKELFNKYKLNIQIKDISIIKKIGDNLFLCNLNVNYKSRLSDSTTQTKNVTEDYIVKIIDVGNMDYKILLPFNSMDKDFSSSNIYKSIKEISLDKQSELIKEQREENEKLEEMNKEEVDENTEDDIKETEHHATIIEDGSSIEEEEDEEDNSDNANNSTEENSSNDSSELNKEEQDTETGTDNSSKPENNNSSNSNNGNTSAYEDFINN